MSINNLARPLAALAAWYAFLPVAAIAHHSTAEYDNSTVAEAQGTVVGVVWRNPHVRLTISTEAFDGSSELWELEGMGVMRLDRAGVPRDLIDVGTTVQFAGNPSTRRQRHMYVTNVLMPDGAEILLRTTAEPRWSANIVSIAQPKIDPARAAADNPDGIFRVWVPAGNRPPEWAQNPPLTAQARAKRDAYDSIVDDPVLDCTPPGMPRVISRSGGHPIRFIPSDGDIILQNEYFELDRLIHMESDVDLSKLEPTALGHSAGRWDGGALIVTTTGIAWPYFQLYGLEGVPQSPAMQIVERFTMNETSDELVYDLTATDPATFTRPVTAAGYVKFRWQPGLEFLPYECVTKGSSD
jgi:hypothetical protein